MKARFLTLIAAAAFSTSALAVTHEISGASNSSFNLTKSGAAGAQTNWSFSFDGGYDYSLSDSLQLGGAVSFFKFKGVGASYGLRVGPTYNFGAFSEAIFAGARLTWSSSSYSDSDRLNYWGFDLRVGKRFEIIPGAYWKPYVSFTDTFKPSPGYWVFDIVPVSISVAW